MAHPPRKHPSQSGAFPSADVLQGEQPTLHLEELSLQAVNEIRLLLRGESVIDWHRLDLQREEESRTLFLLSGLELSDPEDHRRISHLRARAVHYINETLKLHLDEHIASEAEVIALPLIASRPQDRQQRNACLLLKVMHIMHHLDARELRTNLAIADNKLFALVEESVVRMFDELRSVGVPVVEFSWSRKTRQSLVTKMLVKPKTSAARVFDRLRFRLIVKRKEDLEPTLHVMLRRCIPFNYIVPGETVNTLVDHRRLDALERGPSPWTGDEATPEGDEQEINEFTSKKFRVLNFIADLPVRVDELLWENEQEVGEQGRVVFVLAEFQVIDQSTAETNESGDSSHSKYKDRQHARVKERLLKAPSEHGAKHGEPSKKTESD